MQSRLSKQASSFSDDRAKNPQHADTAKMLKMAEPTIVPILILFPSVKKVPTHVIQNSGDEVAIVIKVAAANSCFMLNSKNYKKVLSFVKKKIINFSTLTENVNASDKIFITNDGQHPKTIACQHHVYNNTGIFLHILLIVRKIKEGSMSPHVIFFFRH